MTDIDFETGVWVFGTVACAICVCLFVCGSMTSVTALAVNSNSPSNWLDPYNPLSIISLGFPQIHGNTYADNESYLKRTFDGNMNYDQLSMNRGIDFSKCYSRDNYELNDSVLSDTHYIKIRGSTPDEALKTISIPTIGLKAGFSIPDPSRLYVSQFKQISPDTYKLWVIQKTPAVKSINGAMESTCDVGYWY